ncbi:MAG: response regulator [Chloroflexi bacterium]|nr:response regulator [Chloroflexota bacterium]
MKTNPVKETFIHELGNTLSHLYDPAVLRRSPLMPLFGLGPQAEALSALQHMLTAAVEGLKPDESVPAGTNAWRLYHILYYRYVEQFTQREVATDLALSIRQLRRQEKIALEVLADYLWDHYRLMEKSALLVSSEQADDQDVTDGLDTPSVERELAQLERTIPSELVEVTVLLQAVLDTIQPLAQSLDVSIHCNVPQELPRLKVQLITMRQALLHIASTATRCLPGGRVELSAGILPQGAGIHLQVITRRVDASLAIDKNVGKNLSIARKLIQISGGSLEATLEAKAEIPFTASIILPTTEQIPILVIDDNADTLRLLQRYLSGSRYRFAGTVDPQEALTLAEQLAPEIIVLDVMLPGIDGWELLGRLREHPKTRGAAIIVCTILPQEQLALALGAAEFVRKPISQRAFLAVLDRQIWVAG